MPWDVLHSFSMLKVVLNSEAPYIWSLNVGLLEWTGRQTKIERGTTIQNLWRPLYPEIISLGISKELMTSEKYKFSLYS